MSQDVIIIGAGASGLIAAANLARAGCSALVLDARERIGGRISSHHEPGLAVPVELGAEFIHGRSEATFGVLDQAGAAAVDTGGEHWSLRDGVLHPSDALFHEIQEAMRGTHALKKHDLSFDAFLDKYLKDALSPEARESARMLAQGFDAADTRRASARAIVEEWTGGASVEAPQFRPLGGYGALLAHLASRLRGTEVRVQLETVIRAVRWKRGAVEVRGTFHGRPFAASAKRAIVSLPLGVLQASSRAPGTVRFTPALTAKRDALKHLAPGPVLKVLLRFRGAFWEEIDDGRYRDVAFFHAPKAAFPTFWTTLPIRTPLLVAWAAGPKAMRLAGAEKPQIVSEALKSVEWLFGRRATLDDLLETAWVHDWQTDPYARGAYSYVTVGGDDAREQLAQPLLGTLFFAGEAADCEGEAGTVAGALQSGARAAREVLGSLSKR
ncbi:MAG TPA: NAD(P)/FAD-dependent oxidoreductase [Burkholderiales bacterium]|nr:NAD(P)/FAD-dependent oxidoreductase [Burkholderiales bacterium]